VHTKVIVKTRNFRFGRYIETNDPKETKDWTFDLGTNENAKFGSYGEWQAQSRWLSDKLKSNTRIACFSLDTPPLTGNHIEDIFKRGFCKPRMWAQYAGRHKGACLIFDFQRFKQLVEAQFPAPFLVMSGPVNYADRPIFSRDDESAYTINIDYLRRLGETQYFKSHLLTFYKCMFFEKMTDWQGEREFRWIIFSDQQEDLLVKFGNSLVGIMFGADCDQSEVNDILTTTSQIGVTCTGLKWKNCSPWYDFGNLKYIGFKP